MGVPRVINGMMCQALHRMLDAAQEWITAGTTTAWPLPLPLPLPLSLLLTWGPRLWRRVDGAENG
jgi:hypothetical protein